MATPTRCPMRLVRLPPSKSSAAPASGNAISSHAACWAPVAGSGTMSGAAPTACAAEAARLPVNATPHGAGPGRRPPGTPRSIFQQARVVHRRGPAGTEDRYQDRQSHDHFRGRDHHHEERDHLAVHLAVHPRESDERQVDRVQHELDTHEDDHCVAAHEYADGADHEQDHGERHEVSRAHDRGPSRPFPLVSSPSGWAVLPGTPGPPDPGGSTPLASRRASSTASAAPGRCAMTGLTETAAGVPSGSSAGKSTAL